MASMILITYVEVTSFDRHNEYMQLQMDSLQGQLCRDAIDYQSDHMDRAKPMLSCSFDISFHADFQTKVLSPLCKFELQSTTLLQSATNLEAS